MPKIQKTSTLIETLITSKTRIKILLKFFLNPETTAHMRALAADLNESTNAVRIELNRLEKAGMLTHSKDGNKKMYHVNNLHPLYDPINSMIKQYAGIDHIILNVIKGLGEIEKVYLTGSLANGLETDVIDIVLVGEVNNSYLTETIHKIENGLGKKIKSLVYSAGEAAKLNFNTSDFLLIYEK
jgi:predicted nucleotidyltransferase